MVVGKRLVPDPDTAPIMRRIVAEIIGGTPLAAIARALTDDGVPTPKGAPVWRVTTLTVLVRSRALIGEMTHAGRPVRDADGAVVSVTDSPLLTDTEWAELEAAYAVLSKPHMVSHKADHLLLQVAFCGDCGAPLWHHHFSHRYNMYRCGRRCSPAVRAADLEALIEYDLLTTYGDAKIQRRAARSGVGVEQVAAAAREIAELESDRYDHGLFAGEAGLARYRARMAVLEARLAELQEASAAAPGDRWQATGQTVAERWAASDQAARHTMLRHLGITWHVQQVFRIADHAHRWQIISSWHDEATALERLVRTT
jgi:site-specific DNA recombinase